MTKHPDELTKVSASSSSTKKNSSAYNLPSSNFQILLDVVQKLSLAKDLESVMFIVRKAARKLANADGAAFVLRDGDQCYYADEDAIAPLWKGKRFPMDTCISGWVMLHGEPVVIKDIYADERIPVEAYRPTFVKSLAMIPIRKEAPIGAIGTYWADYYVPTAEQLSLLKALADSTSVAIENIQLHYQLEQGVKENTAQVEAAKKLMDANKQLETTLHELHLRNEQMQWLKELSSKLQTCMYIDEAYTLIAHYANRLLPNNAGIFYIMHASRNYLEAMVSWGGQLKQEKIIKPEECLALRRGAVYTVEDPFKELTCPHNHVNNNMHSYTCIPLFAQSDVIGLLYFEWGEIKNENRDILANMIAEQIAIGISNIKLRDTLRNQSFRDPLTGLYNRRYLEETIDRELSRCARKCSSLAVLMLDIDHFKQFNDKYGHDAGDTVIQALANVLRNFSRKADIVCRYGGEEFIIILSEIELNTALLRAEDLHNIVRKIHLRYGGGALLQITISVGLAMYPMHGETPHELLSAADAALYKAKNSGRDKTVVYEKDET